MNGNNPSLVRAIRGPITLITVGVLFALNNFTPYQFHQTWPVLLIVFGLLSLLRRGIDPTPRPWPAAGVPPYQYTPQPPPVPGVPSYRDSQYPDGPAKGGFGSSAAPAAPPRDDQTPGGSV